MTYLPFFIRIVLDGVPQSYIYSRPKHPRCPLVPLGDYFTAQCTCVREDSLQFSLTLFLMTGGVSTLHWKKYVSVLNFLQYLEFDSKDSITSQDKSHSHLPPRAWLFSISLKHPSLWNYSSASSSIKYISLVFISSINGAYLPIDIILGFIFTGSF